MKKIYKYLVVFLMSYFVLQSISAYADKQVDLTAAKIAYKRKKYEKAMVLMMPFAKKGNAEAQYMVGAICQESNRNILEAIKWYKLAADQGYSKAQMALGWIYEQGLGVPQNHKEAIRWYKLAAIQGNEDAELFLEKFVDE